MYYCNFSCDKKRNSITEKTNFFRKYVRASTSACPEHSKTKASFYATNFTKGVSLFVTAKILNTNLLPVFFDCNKLFLLLQRTERDLAKKL